MITHKLPGWRGMAQNEIDLARALRAILTGHPLTPREMRAQVRLAAALSVRQGDVIGEMTRGLLRATLRSSPSQAALVVLAELEMNTNDIVDQAVIAYLRWANTRMWDDDAEIARIVAAKAADGTDADDFDLIENTP